MVREIPSGGSAERKSVWLCAGTHTCTGWVTSAENKDKAVLLNIENSDSEQRLHATCREEQSKTPDALLLPPRYRPIVHLFSVLLIVFILLGEI